MTEDRETFYGTAGSDLRDAVTEIADEVVKKAGETAGAMQAYEGGVTVTVWMKGRDGEAEFQREIPFYFWRDEDELREYEAAHAVEDSPED